MNNPWATERRRIYALLVVIVLFGLQSGQWALAIGLPTALYIGWQMYQLYLHDHWLASGFKPGKAPHSSGVWESMTRSILKIRKKDKTLQKRLARIAKGYRNTIKALPDAAIVVNHNLEIEWLNPLAEQYLGLHRKRDLDYRICNLVRIPRFCEYLANPSKKPLELELPDQPEITLSIRVIRYGEDQRLILARDISERIQARQALSTFVSNASHELRTPLTVVSGYTELIADDPELPEQLQAPVAQLVQQTGHMQRLIDDLLTLSQLEGDTLTEHEGRTVDLSALIKQFVHDLEHSGRGKQHQIKLELDSGLSVRGIEREMISIYANLIDNALKYTPPGSLVEVKWGLNNENQPCLEVSDDGPGFSSEHAALLTQRFYRINNAETEQTEGSGLGLAIVSSAVRRHGGSLQIRSLPALGASFKVCLPAYRAVKTKSVS